MQSNQARLAEYSKFTESMVAKYAKDPEEPAVEERTAGAEGAAWTGQNTTSDSGSGLTVEDRTADNGLRETIKPNGTEFAAVRMVLQFIHDMTESLVTYHTQDVAIAAECSTAAIQSGCVADYLNPTQNHTLAQQKTDVEHESALHLDCRNSLNTCYEDLASSCPDYDAYRKQQGMYTGTSPNSKLPSCVRTTPDDEKNEQQGTAGAFSDISIKTDQEAQLTTFEDCLKETKAWLDPLYTKYLACRRGEQNCEAQFVQCTTKQHAFERDHCAWKTSHDAVCESLDTCGDEDTLECTGKCEQIAVREGYRNADHETGQRLVCLLNVIFGEPVDIGVEDTEWYPPPANKTTGLAHCKDQDYPSLATPIQCDPGSWEAPFPCHVDDDTKLTCSDEFNKKWYIDKGLQKSCHVIDDEGRHGCTLTEQALGSNVDPCQVDCQ